MVDTMQDMGYVGAVAPLVEEIVPFAQPPLGEAAKRAGAVGVRRRIGLLRRLRRCPRRQARSQAGQSVLVLGASGGVGSYSVQLAHAFGADVTGVCSTAKVDYVTSLGADNVIDYTGQDWADGTHRYDVILDITGNPAMTRLRRALTPRGTVVFVGGEGGGTLTGMSRQLRGALVVSPVVRQTAPRSRATSANGPVYSCADSKFARGDVVRDATACPGRRPPTVA